MRFLTAWSLLSLAVFGLVACGESSPTRAGSLVARVGGSKITTSQLDHWGAIEATLSNTSHREAIRQALALMVASEWTLGEAAAQGITVTAAEVHHQLALVQYEHIEELRYNLPIRNTSLVALVLNPRVQRDDQLWAMRLALLESRLEQKRIAAGEHTITHAQIASYYREHQALYKVPELRDFNIVETFKKSAIEQATRDIRAGQSFRSVAERLTIDPVAPTGIRVNFARTAGSKPLDAAIFDARPGILEGPKKITTYWIFKVTRIALAHEQTLAQAQRSIRRRLASRLASTMLLRDAERRWAARTRCAPGPLRSVCQQRTRIA